MTETTDVDLDQVLKFDKIPDCFIVFNLVGARKAATRWYEDWHKAHGFAVTKPFVGKTYEKINFYTAVVLELSVESGRMLTKVHTLESWMRDSPKSRTLTERQSTVFMDIIH